MKRGPHANGKMIQFHESSIISMNLRNLLYQFFFNDSPTIIFENNQVKTEKFLKMIHALNEVTQSKSLLSTEIELHYLQAFLLQLLEDKEKIKSDKPAEDRRQLTNFQYLLEQKFLRVHAVHAYATELKITEKKLAAVTKQFLGLSPLQVIHNRLLLEAKRLLLFEGSSHKEIAYQLGFDSPATFSQFIKTRTGYNPSDLHHHLVDIHK